MDIRNLLRYLQDTPNISASARATGLNWRTIQRYRSWAEQHGLLDNPLPSLEDLQLLLSSSLPSSAPPQTVSSLEPFRDLVVQLHADGVEGSAILQRLHERGYTGTLSSLYRFLKRLYKIVSEYVAGGVAERFVAGELTAVDQYLIHGETYSDMGYGRLAEKALHESEHERQHARALIQRILFLEGKPDLSKRDGLKIGKTVPDMLKSDLAVEYKVDGELKKAIAACEKAQDYVTREMLVVQLDDTEMDHAYFLEKQLKLIEMVGLENYQQSQMGSTPV